MKLRELVANSLPRVRGKKKKALPGVINPAPMTGAAAKSELSTCRSLFDKCEKKSHSRSSSCDKVPEIQGIAEASWRGNALYRGLEAARAVELNSRLMSTSYTSSRGMVTSHSADEFTPQMMMSRSYDSRLTIQDCSASCSQMWSISESCREPFSSPQQYYQCHYHRHNHLHYHHHHHHMQAPPMTPLTQNQQKLRQDPRELKYIGSFKSQETSKPEHGFFRKSFASFRSMRKQKTPKDTKQAGPEQQSTCSQCPNPDSTTLPAERKGTEKRANKCKRKGLKSLSKSKENRESALSTDKYDKSWFSDNDAQSFASPTIPRSEPMFRLFPMQERPHFRECSVESCSSRLHDSREGSCIREIDNTGFDSASLSGYESDFPRSKVHRSRSRIKTNPWLPSPQPSLSESTRNELGDFQDDSLVSRQHSGVFPRSASFDYQRTSSGVCQNSPISASRGGSGTVQRHRSLTPSDINRTPHLSLPVMPTPPAEKPLWWTDNNQPGDRTSKSSDKTLVVDLNDLNTKIIKSRPNSMVSPNSEFVMLADNLEQLASNISFEYEDMLDTTLESVSIFQEDGQASIQELLTDEENGSFGNKLVKSDGDAQTAPSPDSGIACLGSTDGDDFMTPGAQTETKCVVMECLTSTNGTNSFENTASNTLHDSLKDTFPNVLKWSLNGTFDRSNSLLPTSSSGFNMESKNVTEKRLSDKQYMLRRDSPVSESVNQSANVQDKPGFTDKPSAIMASVSCVSKKEEDVCVKNSALMVEERLDIQYQPPHRQHQGSGIVMGTGGVIHQQWQQLGATGKQSVLKTSDVNSAGSRVVQRPCILKPCVPSKKATRRMNDIEKTLGNEQPNRPWSDEFDMPMNIVGTECMESPTENWRCDGQFSLNDGQNSSQMFEKNQQSASTESSISGRIREGRENEEYIASVISDLGSTASHNTQQKTIEYTTLHENMAGSLESVPVFDMSDACVQTDFNDDFYRWEDTETLQDLEERALDPAESTRIWLLTGNMQGSADTGYSSLTRDSQILMDEDSLILAGELEESAAAERLSCGDASFTGSFVDKTPRNSASFNTTPVNDFHVNVKERSPLKNYDHNSAKTAEGMLIEKPQRLSNRQFGAMSCGTHQSRAIPLYQVNQMFSNIESHFEEIFQRIYHEKDDGGLDGKRLSSDSSDSTLKSSGSGGVVTRRSSACEINYSPSNDSETGESRGYSKTQTQLNLHSDRRNISNSRNTSETSKIPKKVKAENDNKSDIAETNTERDFRRTRSISDRSSQPSSISSHEINTSIPGPASSQDTADYLEFLRDAPLSRSHLKRPLFLVPGVGPVDMASPEQLCLFSKTGSTSEGSLSPCSSSTSHAPPNVTTSPSAVHFGKKQKCQKRNKIFTESPLSSDLPQTPRAKYPDSTASSSRRHSSVTGSKNTNTATIPSFTSTTGDRGRVCNDREARLTSLSQPTTSSSVATTFLKFTESTKKHSGEGGSGNGGCFPDRKSSFRRDKDLCLQKTPEVMKEQSFRQQQLIILEQRKAALLGNLCELRSRLQGESERLKQKAKSNGNQ